MPREGTRSQTGNATPRVFAPVDTAPVIARKKSTKVPQAKTKAKAAPKPVATAKPAGVTKNKAPKAAGVASKVKATVKKVVKKVTKKKAIPKASTPNAAPTSDEPPAAAA